MSTKPPRFEWRIIMKQRMSSNLLFSKAEPKEFVDRIEIKEKIIEICDSMLANPKTFLK